MQTGRMTRESLEGRNITTPTYSVYDAFLSLKTVDWSSLCRQGLGVIRHMDLIGSRFPHLDIEEKIETSETHIKRTVFWKTDRGILHEDYLQDKNNPLLPWRMEYLIKNEQDYSILAYALSEGEFFLKQPEPKFPFPEYLSIPESSVYEIISLGRTPFQTLQIDYAGLERFFFDMALGCNPLFDLLEQLNDQLYKKITLSASQHTYQDFKLWENMSIDVIGPKIYQTHLVPVYQRIVKILAEKRKRLHVHYDGKTKLIVREIADSGIFGIDSFTSSPEGDLTVAEARQNWADTYLWIHPSLSLYEKSPESVTAFMKNAAEEAENKLYSFLVSEDVPPSVAKGLPEVLDALNNSYAKVV